MRMKVRSVIVLLAALVVATAVGCGGATGHYNKGDDLSRQGLYGQAIEQYDKPIQLNPDMALAYNNRGMPTATQDHDKAI